MLKRLRTNEAKALVTGVNGWGAWDGAVSLGVGIWSRSQCPELWVAAATAAAAAGAEGPWVDKGAEWPL